MARALLDITLANEVDVLEHARLSPADREELVSLVEAYRRSLQRAVPQD